MKILMFSAKDFEIPFLEKANNDVHQIKYIPERLTSKTAIKALGFDVVSIFSADDASSKILEKLKDFGVDYISLRSTGYDNINLSTAKKLGIKVAHAPGYSPNAIAEHAVALILALNRKIIQANEQVRAHNYSLSKLVGFDLNQKTVGIIGVGRIGKVIARIMNAFGCNIVAYDIQEDKVFENTYDVAYVGLEELCQQSDIIILSTPLNSATHYLINTSLIAHMKKQVMLINIARGAVVNTNDIIEAIETKKIGYYGADVYEFEKGLFFYDHSKSTSEDKLLQRLMDFPNVLITPHQAFATQEALTNIAETTFYNINCWDRNVSFENELTLELVE